MPAGYSSYVLTSPHEGFLEGARSVNTAQPRNNSFPRFDGTNPRLWRTQCLEYFTRFNIHKCMWVLAASMHMDDKAKVWYEAYKLRQPVGNWSEFMDTVEANFGARDFSPMLGSHVVELSSPSSSPVAAVPGLQDDVADLLPPETPIMGSAHLVREKMLVASEDKTNMGDDVCQTYSESQDDFKTHDISEQEPEWCEASLRDVTQMPEPTVAGHEEVLTHVGGVSLFLKHSVQPTEAVFSELHRMELGGEVFPTAGDLSSLFLEEGLGSTNEVCEAVLLEDLSRSDEVLTHVGGLSLFLEFYLDLSVASVDQVLHEYMQWKYHALYPWSNTRKGGLLLLASMAQTAFSSGRNGMQSSYLVIDKCLPWS